MNRKIGTVDPLAVALAGFVIGMVVAAVVVWLLLYSRLRAQREQWETRSPVSEQTLQVIDSLRQPAFILGAHDEVLRASPAARSTGLVRGTRVTLPDLLDAIRASRREDQPRSFDRTARKEHGSPARALNAQLTPLGAGLVLVVADDYSVLTRVDETRRDFVANVSHELKTPVGALQVLAEAIGAAPDDPDAVAHFADRIQQESQRLGELIAQIIELSRLQSDDPLVHPGHVDLDVVIALAVDHCSDLARGRGVSISVTGERGLRVLGNRDQLISALTNLISNAIAYSDRKARVAVSTQRVSELNDEFIDIRVADNGIGIPAAEIDRIFERFYRADYARSRSSGGTGLGLAIVKHVVAAHGGSVQVWSKVGQGSTFTVRLPALLEATEQPGQASTGPGRTREDTP